jgi:hypothetical protein
MGRIPTAAAKLAGAVLVAFVVAAAAPAANAGPADLRAGAVPVLAQR